MLRLTGIILFSLLLFTNGNAQVKIEKNKKTQQVQQKKELSNQVKRKQELSKNQASSSHGKTAKNILCPSY